MPLRNEKRDRLTTEISKIIDEKVMAILMDYQERMYIEDAELPFDLGIALDLAQEQLVTTMVKVLRYQQTYKEEN